MKCEDAEYLMLECPLDELLPSASKELGRHLASCEHCRGRAETIRRAEASLQASLSRIVTKRIESVPLPHLQPGRVLPLRRPLVWSILGMAAALLLMFWYSEMIRSDAGDLDTGPIAIVSETAFPVAPIGTEALVLDVEDDLQVIWLFQP